MMESLWTARWVISPSRVKSKVSTTFAGWVLSFKSKVSTAFAGWVLSLNFPPFEGASVQSRISRSCPSPTVPIRRDTVWRVLPRQGCPDVVMATSVIVDDFSKTKVAL